MAKCCQRNELKIKRNLKKYTKQLISFLKNSNVITLWWVFKIYKHDSEGNVIKRLRSESCLYTKFNKRREITRILTVYIDGITYNRNWRRNHKNKKNFWKRNSRSHPFGRWSQFYYWGKIWKMQKMVILLHQKNYTKDILKRFNIEKVHTFIIYDSYGKMKKWERRNFNSTKPRKAIGSLLYLAICNKSKPDILFAVKVK